MKHILLFFVLLWSIRAAAQTALYVDNSRVTSGSGTSWTTAFRTLNEALNVANAGSAATRYIISVAKGTYYPTGSQSGTNRDSTFFIGRAGVTVLGGYPTGGGTRNSGINQTTLSGDIGAASVTGDNSFHIMVLAGIRSSTDTVLLDGLYILQGNANGGASKTYNGISTYEGYAGAMVIKNDSCRLQINGCLISGNASSSGLGGAVQVETAPAGFSNCNFSGNASLGAGGAIYINNNSSSAPATINGCTFTGNTSAGSNGGAIYNTRTGGTGAGTIFSNCAFSGNTAMATSSGNGEGGAVYDFNQGSQYAAFDNCFFYGNAARYGGGLTCHSNTVSSGNNYMRRCLFSGNTAGILGGGMYSDASGSATVLIDSSTFTSNKSSGNGGGLYYFCASTSSASNNVQHCLFGADTAVLGGAVYNDALVGYLYNRYVNNVAYDGGAMYATGIRCPLIWNDTFSGNTAAHYGGAIRHIGGSGICGSLMNSLFSGNKAQLGGALSDSANSSQISYCTFAGDTAASGRAIALEAFCAPTILNCIIWDGSGTGAGGSLFAGISGSFSNTTYSIVQGGLAGTGNLSVNPLFVAPVAASLAPTIAGDYSLIPCSPAINAGYTVGSFTGLVDLANNPRLYGSGVDMGAYEYQGPVSFPAITGKSGVCIGTTTQLRNGSPGGSWASSNPAVAAVSSGGLVTGVAVGTDTITYSVGSGTCAGTATKIITVNANPVVAPITGRDTVCENGSMLLSNATGGGVWTSDDNNIAIFSVAIAGTLFGVAPGTVAVEYTVTNTAGCASSVSKNITVRAAPAAPAPITGNSNICLYSTTGMSITTTGGIWSSSDSTKARINSSTGVVTALAPATVFIYYTITDSAGCSSFAAKTLTIDTLDKTVTQAGAQLTANEAGATYQWINCTSGHTPIPGAQAQSFTATANGQYAVIITKNGCTDTSACFRITGLGVAAVNENAGVRIYPNPATDALTIARTGARPATLFMRDMAGKLMRQVALSQPTTSINLQDIAPGVYVLEVYDGRQWFRDKIVVVR